jgi:hypothetical protein
MNTKQPLVIIGNLLLAGGILLLVGLGKITWQEGSQDSACSHSRAQRARSEVRLRQRCAFWSSPSRPA